MLDSWIAEMEDREMARALEGARRKAHYEGNLRACDKTVESMLPELQEHLSSRLNVAMLITELRTKNVRAG